MDNNLITYVDFIGFVFRHSVATDFVSECAHEIFCFFKKKGGDPLNRDGVLFRGQINLLHLLNISEKC